MRRQETITSRNRLKRMEGKTIGRSILIFLILVVDEAYLTFPLLPYLPRIFDVLLIFFSTVLNFTSMLLGAPRKAERT